MRILVVEDHAPCAQFIKIVLLDAGHEVLVARTVGDALAFVDGEPFEALVCDLLFPDGNGCEIIHAVRRKKRDVFAVAVSGLPREVCEAKAIEDGFDTFLQKPFLPQHLSSLFA